MLTVGSLYYMGKSYLVHSCRNGSRYRWILFNRTLTDNLNIPEEEMQLMSKLELRHLMSANTLNEKDLYKANVSQKLKFVVGAIQTDKKANNVVTMGNTNILSRFINTYQDVVNNEYKSEHTEEVTLNGMPGVRYIIEDHKKFKKLTFTEMKIYGTYDNVKAMVSFDVGDMTFNTLFEDPVSVNATAFKNWSWESDFNFNLKDFRRTVISLGAKTLEQLRQEKDLSWYYNKDGTSKKDYRVLHTMDEVKEIVCEIEELRENIKKKYPSNDLPIAIDCETTGLNFINIKDFDEEGNRNKLKDEIGGMSLTWKKDQGVYIPFLHTRFENVPREECFEFLKPYLEKWYMETHNGLFDGKAFWDSKIRLNIKDDSMIMLFNINPTVAKGSKGLKENTLTRYGHETLDHDDVFPSKKDVTTFFDLPEELVKIYTCADSDYTHRLCTDLRKELPSKKPYRLDMRVMYYLIKVNYNGNKIDEVLLHKLSSVVDEDLKTLEKLMYKYVGQMSYLHSAYVLLEKQKMAGALTTEEAEEMMAEFQKEDEYKNAYYEFSPSKPQTLVDILYTRLGYPIKRRSKTTNEPTADKYALKMLAEDKLDDAHKGNWMRENVQSAIVKYQAFCTEKEATLINADDFNKMKYPFVMLLQKWKDLTKLKTTFFAWFLNGDCEGKYFADFSMTNAETSRIIGRIQTLKGSMKELVVPYSEEYYLLGVDFSQIEARLMAYLAEQWPLVEELCNPRADYHIASASMLTGKEGWQITKQERGELKSVNFAVPYGMAEYSLAENLYGAPVTENKLIDAGLLLSKWKRINHPIQSLLDHHREFAKQEREIPFFNTETRQVEPTLKRFVQNKFGRRRYFSDGKYAGHELDQKTLASIDRMAGNYPIQSYAAEIFKTAFVNINRRLEKEHLEDKVFITALVHDEFLFNVHRSVDKYKMYEILWEEMVQCIYLPFKTKDGKYCMTKDGKYLIDKEHPVKYFFAGISIGDEWHDIHGNDAHEAPTEYLMHMVDRIKSGDYQFKEYEHGDVTKECFNETKEFMRELLMKECFKLQPDLRPDNVKFYQIVPAFFDYFLKGKLKIYVPETNREVKHKDESDDIRARLEALMCERFSTTSLTCYDEDALTSRQVTIEKSDLDTPTLDTPDLNVPDLDVPDLNVPDLNVPDLPDTSVGDILKQAFFNEKEEDDALFYDDEDLDNFDDDDEEESAGYTIRYNFNISKEEDEDRYVLKDIDKTKQGSGYIWDYIKPTDEDAKPINSNVKIHILETDYEVIVDVSDSLDTKIVELIKYFKEIAQDEGKKHLTLRTKTTAKTTELKVDAYSKQKVMEIMGWSLF